MNAIPTIPVERGARWASAVAAKRRPGLGDNAQRAASAAGYAQSMAQTGMMVGGPEGAAIGAGAGAILGAFAGGGDAPITSELMFAAEDYRRWAKYSESNFRKQLALTKASAANAPAPVTTEAAVPGMTALAIGGGLLLFLILGTMVMVVKS